MTSGLAQRIPLHSGESRRIWWLNMFLNPTDFTTAQLHYLCPEVPNCFNSEQLIRFYKNEFDEILHKLDSTELEYARSF